MAMTNAERQRRHRERMKQKIALADDPRLALWGQVKPLIRQLEAEGKKNMATMSPGTVAKLAHELRLILDPDYAEVVERRKAKALKRVT